MVFVEVFRLLLVIAGVVGGMQIGEHAGSSPSILVVDAALGALFSYVIGGICGRFIDRALYGAVKRLSHMSPAAVFAGSVVGTTGLLLGLGAAMALSATVHSRLAVPVAAVLSWVFCAGGIRIGVAKGEEIVRAAGLAHILGREPAGEGLLLLDTSAVLERNLVVLGRCGLLAGGVLVPRFVLDEVQLLCGGPDPVVARKAHRGLETLEALREQQVVVHVSDDEVPDHDVPAGKAVALARRLGARLATCSADVVDAAAAAGVQAVNLRRLADDLAPGHVIGERLVVELVKEGRLPRQAIGYLADGDMVVVNDAGHLVGGGDIEVVVCGVRPTSQGVLLFAEPAGAAVPA